MKLKPRKSNSVEHCLNRRWQEALSTFPKKSHTTWTLVYLNK